MASIQRSAPIDIQRRQAFTNSLHLQPRERHDTISRIKAENSRKRSYSNSLSPDLSSPTPPTFVPDGTHQLKKLDNYLFIEQVGGHNSGNVFLTEDINTSKEYICKVYDIKDYRKHIEPYTRLSNHPNINGVVDLIQGATKVYSFFNPGTRECDNSDFKVENLHSHLRSKGKLSEEDGACLFKQIVSAVNHCHENNIVVRDLKLRKFIFKDSERQNIMMENLDDSNVLDSFDDKMADKHGCPAYVSPEILQCSAQALSCLNNSNCSEISGYSGKAADVWCMGVILYTLLVGRYPFQERDVPSLFCKIRRAQYTIPEKLSTQAKDLIYNLLQRDIDKRLNCSEILKHPWIVKEGRCWDEPRFVMPIGFGGDQRVTQQNQRSLSSSWQAVPCMDTPTRFDYGDEQLVPDSYVSEEDETMFDF